MMNFLNGKKTYLVALAAAGTAFAQAMGYPIPEWAYAALGALGLGTMRSAVTKAAASK